MSTDEIRTVLADTLAADAPDPAAQEKRWRAALKRAKNARRQLAEAARRPARSLSLPTNDRVAVRV